MGILMGIFSFLASFFSKPKKLITSAPKIQPCVVKIAGKTKAWYRVLEEFTVGRFTVPRGTLTDGRSGGILLSYLIGSDAFDPHVLAACIAHDCKYNNAIIRLNNSLEKRDKKTKKEAMDIFRNADNEFYDDLRENNRHFRCTLFFLGVRAYSSLFFAVWTWYITRKQIETTGYIIDLGDNPNRGLYVSATESGYAELGANNPLETKKLNKEK
jgi:hypothetical protein